MVQGVKTIKKILKDIPLNTDIEISNGNMKLSKNTIIINMGSATNCPSNILGMCNAVKSGVKCYALKAEKLYPNSLKYRERQFTYWRSNSADSILKDIIRKISNRNSNTSIKYIRFNESGDFWDQHDIKKLSTIAKRLKNFGIITYGYTARYDLDFKHIHFLVKGSGFTKKQAKDINGRTIIINKTDPIPDTFLKCPGSCKTCDACFKPDKQNIAFIKH